MTPHAFKTPPLPESFRALRADGYRNVYELSASHTHLYGTETLCGDWDGDLLLLAQDYLPADRFGARIAAGEALPYSHFPNLPTNRRIVKLLEENGRSVERSGAAACGVLYGSACFLLKDGKNLSSALRNQAGWWAASRPVFHFTLQNMPRLTDIACLGKQSYDFVLNQLGSGAAPAWREARNARRPILRDGLRVWAHSHPGGQGLVNRLEVGAPGEREAAISADWRAMFAAMG